MKTKAPLPAAQTSNSRRFKKHGGAPYQKVSDNRKRRLRGLWEHDRAALPAEDKTGMVFQLDGNLHPALSRSRRWEIGKVNVVIDAADVVITNPTHIAIALRYDRKNMRAPKVVAKGIRLDAQQIREIAQQHQIPIIENKPLAQILFKQAKVGGEIPAQLYVAVAEILSWVYRVNRYRYYAEQNQA